MTNSNAYAASGGDTEFGDITIFSFSGRIGRVRYFAYSVGFGVLFMLVMGVLVGIATSMGQEAGMVVGAILYFIGSIVMLVFSIMFGVQRLHDLGQSGWLYLLILVPLVNMIFWLYLAFAPGSYDSNQYGNPPPPNSGGVTAVAIIVPVVWVVLMVFVAALAIPAYQNYLMRAQENQQHSQ